jgi:hypothetical protein
MERHVQSQQLDLLELTTNATQRKRLDHIVHAEIVSLLKLLITECSAAVAKAKGAHDE